MLTDCYKSEMRKRHISGDLDALTEERIGRVAKWLREGRKPGLMLFGTVGNGKTTMATAACELIGIIHDSAWQSERKFVRRIAAPDLVSMKLSDEPRFEVYKKAEMLFVDDLGTESASIKSYGNEMTPIIDLLYYRYDQQLFTITTSNLDDASARSFYGERLADRFSEMFDKLSYTNPSYRQ